MQRYHLEKTLINEIPVARFMGVKIIKLQDEVVLSAPLEPNINTHGTAFGGSLVTLATLTGWCCLGAKLLEWGMEPNIVIAQSEIKYLQPVKEDLQAVCLPPQAEVWQDFRSKLVDRGRAKLTLQCQVLTKDGVAAKYSGVYVAALEK